MKRADKIAILTRVFQGTDHQTARMHLQRALKRSSTLLVIIDDPDNTGHVLTDLSLVSFQEETGKHRMTFFEAQQYAKRRNIKTLFVLPDNGRDIS